MPEAGPTTANGGDTSSRRLRLLAVGPALDLSSYSRVVHGTLAHLAGWDIDHLGINYHGSVCHSPWRIHPNRRPDDRLGIAETIALANATQPHAIFIFNSFLSLPRYWQVPTQMGVSRPLLVLQCPLLGEVIDPRLVARLAFADCIVVLGETVKRHFEDCLRLCVRDGYIETAPPVAVIPHGIDKDTFYPLPAAATEEGRRHIKQAVFGADLPEDSFIVLNANRNETRKRIDVTLRGFAMFARDKRAGVRLHLHMTDSPNGGLTALARELGIADRVTFAAPAADGRPALSDQELNRLYNACDLGINTASAEGWGMISFEHAATGAAQIVPGHGVCADLWAGCAEVLAITSEPPGGRYTKEYLVSPESVAEALQRLYGDAQYRSDVAARGRRNALRPEFQWSEIGAAWSRLLSSLLERQRPALSRRP